MLKNMFKYLANIIRENIRNNITTKNILYILYFLSIYLYFVDKKFEKIVETLSYYI